MSETDAGSLGVRIVPVTPFQQNCAILWDPMSGDAVVVDPGGDVPQILAAMHAENVTPSQIWLTHGHLDHAGGTTELREAMQKQLDRSVPIIGPDQRDRFLLDNLQEQAALFGVSGMRNVIPDRWLKEGEHVSLGTHSFKVLHCPGHTPGHIVFIQQDAKFAILGDVLFRGSIGRTDFPYGDHDALLTAIRTKLLPLADDVRFLCGHGPGSTIGAERRSNPFLQT